MRSVNSRDSHQKNLLYDTRQNNTTSQTIPQCPSSHIQMNSRERLTATCTGHVNGSSSLIDLTDFTPKNQKLFSKFKNLYDHFFLPRSILFTFVCFSLMLTFCLPYFKWNTKSSISDPSTYFKNSIKKIESKLGSILLDATHLKTQQTLFDHQLRETEARLLQKIVNVDQTFQGHISSFSKYQITRNDYFDQLEKQEKYIQTFNTRLEEMQQHIKILTTRLNKYENAEQAHPMTSLTSHESKHYEEKYLELQKQIEALNTTLYYDGTQKVDWARASLGASIDEAFTTSPRYSSLWNDFKWVLIFFFPRFYGKAQPRSHPANIIIGSAKPISFSYDTRRLPGQCFAFEQSKGNVTLRLPTLVNITEVHIDHVPPQLLPSWTSAPRLFNVYIDDCVKEDCTKRLNSLKPPSVLLGSFEFLFPYYSSQTFSIDTRFTSTQSRRIRFEFIQNWGSSYTCIYRLRVHGNHIQRFNRML